MVHKSLTQAYLMGRCPAADGRLSPDNYDSSEGFHGTGEIVSGPVRRAARYHSPLF